jgi:hypothetical protein
MLGCGSGKPEPQPDRRTRSILEGATAVEVYRIDSEKVAAPGDPTLDGYLVVARGQDRGEEFAARLAEVLLDPGTYSHSFALCFDPGVAYRLRKGRECLDIVICFHCENVYLGPPTRGVRENASFHESPARHRLVRLAKEAFPEDKEIQGLKE